MAEKTQKEKFEEAADELGPNISEKDFEKALKVIAQAKKATEPFKKPE